MIALIIDDEEPARRKLHLFLGDFPQFTEVYQCEDGLCGIKMVDELSPNIIFLDIQMPGMSGIDTAREITESQSRNIIFVTAYDRFAIAAFEVNAIDYLLKPFSKERFETAVNKALKNIMDEYRLANLRNMIDQYSLHQSNNGIFMVKENNSVIPLRKRDIIYMKAEGNYVALYTERGRYLVRTTMNHLGEDFMAPFFLRVHKSYMINTSYLVKMEKRGHNDFDVYLIGNEKVPASRAFFSNYSSLIMK